MLKESHNLKMNGYITDDSPLSRKEKAILCIDMMMRQRWMLVNTLLQDMMQDGYQIFPLTFQCDFTFSFLLCLKEVRRDEVINLPSIPDFSSHFTFSKL